MATKKVETSTSGWSNLHADISYLLLDRLCFVDRLRFRDVCKAWCSFANTHILNMLQLNPQPPLLVLPTLGNECSGFNLNVLTKVFSPNSPSFPYKLEELIMIKSFRKEFLSSCLGSSGEWLVFFDSRKDRYHLFNPIIDVRVSLGSLPKLLLTSKIVLWSDPILPGRKYAVVAMHGSAVFGGQSRMAYAFCGDNSWSLLDNESYPYCDIICNDKYVYALGVSCFIEAWDFSDGIPVKKMRVQPSTPERNVYECSKKIQLRCRRYLVKSQDDLLMVVRYTQEVGLRSFYLRWKTLSFQVYKLEINGKNWVKTDCLGDRIIFLGANQSISLSGNDCHGYEKNSIYFSNDYWGLKFRDYHDYRCDIGVFNLGDGSINFFLESYLIRSHPGPFWLVSRYNL